MGNNAAATPAATPDVWLSKQKVCEILGLGDRAVEKLAQSGVLRKHVLPRGDGRRYTVPMFDPESVQAYKEGRLLPAVVRVRNEQPPPEEETPEHADDIDAIPRYAFCTLQEAARIVRMPVGWVMGAINDGRLAYETTPRGGLRVRRADIEDLGAHRRRKLSVK